MKNDVRNSLMALLGEKLKSIGIKDEELGNHFDLVKSGLVNSLEFVDLVSRLEKEFRCEIDYETVFEKGNFTTIGGLILTFENQKNG